jgi:thiamine-monophosphate kinase
LSLYEQVKIVPGIHIVGHINDVSLQCKFVTRDDQEMELQAQGWNPILE